jgi:hypothetical protein
VTFGLCAFYQIPFGQQAVPAGVGSGLRPKPVSLTSGLRHLAERTGVPMLFGGPNGTKKGAAFAALQVREASG